MPPEELFGNNQAARYIGIVPGTLHVWRCENRYAIPYLRIGNRIRYRKSDLDAFLASCLVKPREPKPARRRRRAA